MQEMSQADFARAMGVTRAAVSQWKAKDILREDAFTKEGKKGKLRFEVAVEQVRRNRDIGQSLGNGIATRTTQDTGSGMAGRCLRDAAAEATAQGPPAQVSLPLAPPVPKPDLDTKPQVIEPDPPAPVPPPARIDTVEDQLKRAKLEEQLRRNRMQATEEAQRSGQLMEVATAREQMGRVASSVLMLFEGALPDLALAMAERFDVPQRDALHLLRAEMVEIRRKAAAKTRAQAEATAQEVAVPLEGDG